MVAVLGVPVLVGLFGVAVALGTLGRVWSGPATLMSHLDLWGTAVVAAVSSVLLNNLPAASLFAARVPAHPLAMLVGLNLGPNLFVTGSLAWFLWLRAARTAGARPSIAKASRIGVVRRAPLDGRRPWRPCAQRDSLRTRRRARPASQNASVSISRAHRDILPGRPPAARSDP